jgi:hypothetical protein
VGKSKDQTRIVKQIEKMKIPTPRWRIEDRDINLI